ncbi:MAG TPA: hypothetical protein PLF31_00620 [Candidatus Paceibacterota bacterium]|nr:hypothetical protein [Candidatus Paceibacterota bacterium]
MFLESVLLCSTVHFSNFKPHGGIMLKPWHTKEAIRRSVKVIVAESTLFEGRPEQVPTETALQDDPIGIVDRFFYRLLNQRVENEFHVTIFDDTELNNLDQSGHARSVITVEEIVNRIDKELHGITQMLK